MNVPLLSVFFLIFKFFFKQLTPQKWPFIVIVQLQIWGAALHTEYEMITTSMGVMKSFNSDSKKMKMWQCIILI